IQEKLEAEVIATVTKIGEQHYSMSGKVLINEVNDLLGTNLSDEEVDTLGGWILSQNVDITEGEVVLAEGFTFTVREVEGHQIQYVEVKKNEFIEEPIHLEIKEA